jgi:hypothetical protein
VSMPNPDEKDIVDETAPDFEALRAKRNAEVQTIVEAVAAKMGWEGPVHFSFDPNACYCACGSGGPCEHDFKGWRDLTDDKGNVCGGETVCQRCGMGSMSHSLRCCDF